MVIKSAMNRWDWIVLLLAAGVVVFQCFWPPVVGIANNGDFPKIAGRLDVGNPSDIQDVTRFIRVKYVVDPKYRWDSRFYSSELLLFAAAFGLSSIFGNPAVFDMRLMGVIHAAIFLLAFYLLLPLLRSFTLASRAIVLVLILCVFTDVMYISYFNTLYMDTAALLFLLLAVVSFLRALRWQKAADRWLFVVSAVLLITSKTQHYPLGVPVAVLLAWSGGLLVQGRGRLFRTLSVIVVTAATAFSDLRETPTFYPAMGAYTVIFSELLPKSKDISGDLQQLGLDDSYRRYIGTNAYSSDAGFRAPEFQEAFSQRPFYAYLAWFLLRHPSRALDVTVARLDRAGLQRPYLGNFERTAGFPEYARSRAFAAWSGLKAALFGLHGGRYLIYSFGLVIAVVANAIARRQTLPAGIPAAICALGAMTLLELLVASFADALDPERHYSLFSALTDLLVICGVCLVVVALRARPPVQLTHGVLR
jgi:hypothetical protein